MSYARAPYDEGGYSSGVVPTTARPGQQLPPPVPGATTHYQWAIQPGVLPYSYGGYSGASAPAEFTGGGLIVAPEAENGVVIVRAWWPDAGQLQVVRMSADGTRHPVRGGYPLTTSEPTRRNWCPNPSAAAGLNGYVPGAGNPELSQITRSDLGGGTAWRATVAADGANELVIPHQLPGASPYTIGVDLRVSVRPATVTLTVGFTDASGNATAPAVAVLTADQINCSVGQFSRQIIHLYPPTTAVTVSTVKLAAQGMAGGSSMDGSRITMEQGLTDGSPFDGGTLGAQWLGVTGLSVSVLAPVLRLDDGECPLDQPVIYMVYNPRITGGSAAAPATVLPSRDRSWITHPDAPAAPVRCYPTAVPTLTRKLTQGSFAVIGRRYPVVVSAPQRTAPEGTLTIATETFADRDRLVGLLDDGQPVLLRAPGDYGYGDGLWISLGDLAEDPGGRPAWSPGRTLSASFQVVDAPSGTNLVVA